MLTTAIPRAVNAASILAVACMQTCGVIYFTTATAMIAFFRQVFPNSFRLTSLVHLWNNFCMYSIGAFNWIKRSYYAVIPVVAFSSAKKLTLTPNRLDFAATFLERLNFDKISKYGFILICWIILISISFMVFNRIKNLVSDPIFDSFWKMILMIEKRVDESLGREVEDFDTDDYIAISEDQLKSVNKLKEIIAERAVHIQKTNEQNKQNVNKSIEVAEQYSGEIDDYFLYKKQMLGVVSDLVQKHAEASAAESHSAKLQNALKEHLNSAEFKDVVLRPKGDFMAGMEA